MTEATQKMMQAILDHARARHEIFPFMFQPRRGQSNTVSAAIRVAKARGLIEQAGLDGLGKPTYRATEIASTHAGSAAIN